MPLSNAKMKNPILPKINTESLILPQNPISTEVSCLLPEFQAALDVLPKSLVYTFSKLRSLQIDIDGVYYLSSSHPSLPHPLSPFFFLF
ncbi:hypothetical protein HMI54_008523 [Coelomomyces lativittatus]|nr:hypothetical protein HMI54_008523 [Coelomomyces lativittatus]KAJ1503088.1 hypothetical protein HMI56_002346 [Coelomomyces lativittatus]